jgi:hypothetical protein
MTEFQKLQQQAQMTAAALSALQTLADAGGRIAALAMQLQTLATSVEAAIDPLAPVVGCEVEDVYASWFEPKTTTG